MDQSNSVKFSLSSWAEKIPGETEEEDDNEVVSAPDSSQHRCFRTGYENSVKRAREKMQACVAKDSTKSVPSIYNECRNEAADEFPGSSKEAFLQAFPSYKACQKTLYTERRTKVPPNPQEPSAIKLNLRDLPTVMVGERRALSKVMQ